MGESEDRQTGIEKEKGTGKEKERKRKGKGKEKADAMVCCGGVALSCR